MRKSILLLASILFGLFSISVNANVLDDNNTEERKRVYTTSIENETFLEDQNGKLIQYDNLENLGGFIKNNEYFNGYDKRCELLPTVKVIVDKPEDINWETIKNIDPHTCSIKVFVLENS